MPTVSVHELRQLKLPAETVLDALLEFDREHGGSLWRTTIHEARLVSGADAGMVVTVQTPDPAAVELRKFDLPMIAASIIQYCLKSRIPLPRQGTKSIAVVDARVVFTIESDVTLRRRHDSAPIPAIAANPKETA